MIPGGVVMPFPVEIAIAIAGGFLIGAISSMLGVAGGKFIIPVLVLIFGADIKTAGTASILISTRSKTLLSRLAIPMSAGSIVGALAGGYAAQWVSGDTSSPPARRYEPEGLVFPARRCLHNKLAHLASPFSRPSPHAP